MANRLKEDEKNERIIRGLLKLPSNRRCINCNSLGPQYVCTNFSIFICTNCSGIHREFTHRVKSVSMAKFSSQEVANLQEGGNERAREIFFKDWDAQRQSFPDSSNVDSLRTFIKHVYVDRRFSGEKAVDRPPRSKGDRDDYEQRKPDMFRGGSRSPPYEDRRNNDRSSFASRNDERNFRYNYDERRSPGSDKSDYRRSPNYSEVVDDRRRDDKPGNVDRRFEERRFPDGASKPEGSSPNHQKSYTSSPVVRPVRDILGDDAPSLQVGEPPKSNGARVIEGPPAARVASASSSGSTVVNPTEQKITNTVSLIDFDADPQPSVATTTAQSVAVTPAESFAAASNPPASEANWASFDSVTVPNPSQGVTNSNSLESVLTQLSVSGDVSTTATPLSLSTAANSSPMTTAVQLPTVQQEPSLFSQPSNQPTVQPSNQPTVQPFAPSLVGGSSDQSLIPSSSVPSLAAIPGQATQALHASTIESSTAVSSLPNAEAKSSARKELPADLFTFAYPTSHPSMMGWQNRPSFGMALPMQYPPQIAPSFSYSAKSANPFDVSSEQTLAHSSTFPSLVSLQGSLPRPANSLDMTRSASVGTMPFSQLPQNQPPSLMTVPSGYMGQQFQSNIPVQLQGSIPQQIPNNPFPAGNGGIGNVPNQMPPFASAAVMSAGVSQPGTPNAFRPSGGNPFG